MWEVWPRFPGSEGRPALDHLVDEAAQREPVGAVRVLLVVYDLWSHVPGVQIVCTIVGYFQVIWKGFFMGSKKERLK